jgi:hypothetical protein
MSNEISSNRWVIVIHNSEYTKELGYGRVTFVSAEDRISMCVAVTS